MTNLSVDDLRNLSRRDLQGLAKSHSLKANGSSNKLIEALCDRFPAGVPLAKRGSSPTTTSARAGTRRAGRRQNRCATPPSPTREPAAHESLTTSRAPTGTSRRASNSLTKYGTERLLTQPHPEPTLVAEEQPLRREDALVLRDTEELLRQMMEELQEARAMSRRLASENAALRAQLAEPSSPNALQLGEDPVEGPSSQITQPLSGPTNSQAPAAGQPLTPASLRQPEASLPHEQEPQVAPSPRNLVREILASVPPRPQRTPSPTGFSQFPRIYRDLNDRKLWCDSLEKEVTLGQARIRNQEAIMYGNPSETLQQRVVEGEKAKEKDVEFRKANVTGYGRAIFDDVLAVARDGTKRDYGELVWTVGDRELETYPHMKLSEEEKKNLIRFDNWAVRADEITLPLVYGFKPFQSDDDEIESDYLPPSDEDPDYDATSDLTPSELEDVEMQDMDMSVEDDLAVGVEGQGIDALLTDLAGILRGSPPMYPMQPTRNIIPDHQGYLKLPHGNRSHICWVPVKEKERVWVRCDQDVCTHGAVPADGQQNEGGTPDEGQQKAAPQGPCYFFDDLPAVAGKPKPKGRWVERDVDLLEGGKYVDACIQEMDVVRPGYYGSAWAKVKGWKRRLERIQVWDC